MFSVFASFCFLSFHIVVEGRECLSVQNDGLNLILMTKKMVAAFPPKMIFNFKRVERTNVLL